jgi:DNA repair protein RecO (recombination protein O)
LPYKNTQGIVLSRTDYRENDRMITLLSPDFGRVDALCRGCRKPKSPLMTAGELFCMGEYVLFSAASRETVTACTVIEAFYPLRLNYARLSYGAMMLSASQKMAQPGEAAPHLFILLARSLKRLSYEETPADQVGSAFLLHLAAISGFKPRLNHCVRCARRMGEEEGGFLLAQEGGICCSACGSRLPLRLMLPAATLAWLRQVLAIGIDKAETAPKEVPYAILADYVEYHIDSKLPAVTDEDS